jgi:hypothetical protein
MIDQALVEAISRGQALEIRGDRAGARAVYEGMWIEATRVGDLYQACAAAHFLAHTYAEPEAQLEWHLRALHAGEVAGDERVRAFYPSLHANLAEVYLRLNDRIQAREHLDQAHAAEYILQDDGYGRMLRGLIARLTQDLESGS